MTEEEKIVSQETQTSVSGTGSDADLIAALKELKQTTVPKADYEKLQADNKRLIQEVVNGQVPEAPKVEVVKDLKELRKFIHSGDGMLNLEYVKHSLELRDELIKRGEKDPFAPIGPNAVVTYEDEQAAQRVADVFQQCVDYADGDSALFTQELQRRTNDIRIRK